MVPGPMGQATLLEEDRRSIRHKLECVFRSAKRAVLRGLARREFKDIQAIAVNEILRRDGQSWMTLAELPVQ